MMVDIPALINSCKITDWAMVIITAIYVGATIKIYKSNKETEKVMKEQLDESKRQFEESKRLEYMPFLQMEIITTGDYAYDYEIPLCLDGFPDNLYRKVVIKNVGNGTAINILYSWEVGEEKSVKILPINAIMGKDKYCFQLNFKADEISAGKAVNLTWQYRDILNNLYEQRVIFVFNDKGYLKSVENDDPKYLGEEYYLKK